MKKTIVLIWKMASWKDFAGEYIANKLWVESIWISSWLRIIAQQRGVEETRENLIKIGKEVAKKHGDWYLAEILLQNSSKDIVVITGPRQLGQLKFLRENTDSIFVGILADPVIRYERMMQRGKVGENISFERFLQEEQMEEAANQSAAKCLEQSDIFIENNGSVKEFEEKMLKFIKSNFEY